jgi:hypothetical protein
MWHHIYENNCNCMCDRVIKRQERISGKLKYNELRYEGDDRQT